MKIAGHNIPKWAAWGGAIGGGLVLYIYFKNRASGSSQSGTDPATGLPYSQDDQTDPLTGMTYAAEASEYGSVAAAEEAASTASEPAYGASSGTYGYVGSAGYPTENVTDSTTTGSYATNAAWSQAATAGLSSLGYSATDIAAALGLYFAGAPLTSDQASIVQAAVAEFGPPPQGTYSIVSTPSSGGAVTGTGGTTTTSSGGTSSGAGTSGSVTAPKSAPAASISGGRVMSVSNNDAVIAWQGSNAVKYVVKISGPGAINGHTSTVTIPKATYSGLQAGHTYDVTVTPYNSAGHAGKPGVITIETK